MNQLFSNTNRYRSIALGLALIATAVTGMLGCETIGRIKVDNPVMGPPPPRISTNDEALPSDAPTVTAFDSEESEVTLVTAGADVVDKVTEESQVVATVNGQPIFAADLLEPYQSYLQKAEEEVRSGKMPASVLDRQKRELMQKHIDGAIERKLLEQALRKTLKKEQLDMIDVFLEQAFQQEAQRVMAKENIQTMHELDLYFKEAGYSLAAYRRGFESSILSTEYLRAKQGETPKLTREDLMKYYREHIEEYTNPQRVKWQFLLVEYKKHGGRQGAYVVLNKAVEELKQGVDFAEVVRKYSDSATRSNGGLWNEGDWTTPGSLSDTKLEEALFTMPVGRISEPFASDTEFKLAKVIEREAASVTPFDEVQTKIEKEIVQAQREKATKEVKEEIYEKAVIESIFDKEEDVNFLSDSGNPFSQQ
ncbi:MAG: hypothetical protein CMJ46_05095 [Planctomyces sp.]|nr:hypothetical protein [Planctomyces sp.]